MKKFSIILFIAIFAIMLVGCGSNQETVDAIEEPDVTTEETVEEQEEVDDGYETITWGATVISSEAPVPTWSDRGKIYSDSVSLWWVDMGYATDKDFYDYVEQCKEAGFDIDPYLSEGVSLMYVADKENGHGIQVCYNHYEKEISIMVDANAENVRPDSAK